MMGINWDEIDNVMLDMDGTLLDLHFDNFFWLTYLPEHYATKFPGQEEKARHWLSQQLKDRRGSLEWYCTDFWTKELDIEIIALKHEVSHLINQRPYVIRFLKALAVAKKNRMLVTNAHPKSVELKFSKTQISSLLDCVITSHDYGHPKESQKFWHKFARDYQFDSKKNSVH
jgi:putative hydrolase of the HAD superfamily